MDDVAKDTETLTEKSHTINYGVLQHSTSFNSKLTTEFEVNTCANQFRRRGRSCSLHEMDVMKNASWFRKREIYQAVTSAMLYEKDKSDCFMDNQNLNNDLSNENINPNIIDRNEPLVPLIRVSNFFTSTKWTIKRLFKKSLNYDSATDNESDTVSADEIGSDTESAKLDGSGNNSSQMVLKELDSPLSISNQSIAIRSRSVAEKGVSRRRRYSQPSLIAHSRSNSEVRGSQSLWARCVDEKMLLLRLDEEKAANLQNKRRYASLNITPKTSRTYDGTLIEQWRPYLREDLSKGLDKFHTTGSTSLLSKLASNEDKVTEDKINVFVTLARRGVPSTIRGRVWLLVSSYHPKGMNKNLLSWTRMEISYKKFLDHGPGIYDDQIRLDLSRTFPEHAFFSDSDGVGQRRLFNVMKAYSLFDPDVGYCQGMAFVVGILLLQLNESGAFFCLANLMYTYRMRELFKPKMSAIKVRLYQLARLIHDRLPQLDHHFKKHEIMPDSFAAEWFLTLFASTYPLIFVFRVMDLVLTDGIIVIFRLALKLLTQEQEYLLECKDVGDIILHLKTVLPKRSSFELKETLSASLDIGLTYHELSDLELEFHLIQQEHIALN